MERIPSPFFVVARRTLEQRSRISGASAEKVFFDVTRNASPDIAFVDEARIAGDDEQPFDARQPGDDVVDHSVDEIFLQEDKANAPSRSFLTLGQYADERSRRSDAGKWETVLHAQQRMRGSSLIDPVFDIHYVARQDAGPTRSAPPLDYALVVTIEAPKHIELFSTILAQYKSLVAIEPEVSLPIHA